MDGVSQAWYPSSTTHESRTISWVQKNRERAAEELLGDYDEVYLNVLFKLVYIKYDSASIRYLKLKHDFQASVDYKTNLSSYCCYLSYNYKTCVINS